jgi:hypothetical protein
MVWSDSFLLFFIFLARFDQAGLMHVFEFPFSFFLFLFTSFSLGTAEDFGR